MVRFRLLDRIALIPVEIACGFKSVLIVSAVFLVASGLGPGVYSPDRVITVGVWSSLVILGGFVGGAVATPVQLPWLPGRPFSIKGVWVGLPYALLIGAFTTAGPRTSGNLISAVSWLLIIPALTSYLALNFTGASTFTSLSGVKREVRVAVPIQIAAGVAGAIMWVAGLFI